MSGQRYLYTILLAGGLLGLLALIMSDLRFPVPQQSLPVISPAAAGMQPLTDGGGMDGFGTWSPDGSQVAFMRNGRIWLMNGAGEGERPLTRTEGVWDSVSAWRPDGKELAFIRLALQQEQASLMLVDPATGKERELVSEPGPVGHLVWAPDGQALYYSTHQQLKRVDLTGKSQRLYTVPTDWDLLAGGLAIAPDGSRLIYGAGPQTPRGVHYDLWVLSLQGSGEPEQLTRTGGIMPGLDRTGQHLIYRNPRQKAGIYLMDLARHQTRKIMGDEQRALYFHPAFSPDGKSLIISRLELDSKGPGSGNRFISHLWLHRLGSSGGD